VLPYGRYQAAVAQYEINGPQITFLPAAVTFQGANINGATNVFSVQPQKLASLASTADVLPGTGDKSTVFSSASISRSGALAFSNLVPAIRGGDRIFLKRQNQIKLIYQLGQTVQGLRKPPVYVEKACLSGNQVTFSSDAALLVSRGGKVSPLVQLGDQLDGKTVSSIFVGKKRYCSGRFFVFQVRFTDETSGIYRGEILPDMNSLVAGKSDEADE
jgi:hypothetical protein